MRILVTGGAGFIGSNYVRRILDGTLEGITKVVVIDKLTYAGNKRNLSGFINEMVEFVEGDICNFNLVNKLIKSVDAIINFAAETHVDRSIAESGKFVTTNIIGTHSLLEATLRNNKGNFVQVSTDEVYGSINEGSWTEESPLYPNSPYAASKASADLIALSYFKTHQLDVKLTRCSNNYGPFQFPEKVIPLFVTNLLRGKRLPLYGRGDNRRDWLHVDDHCKAIHKVLQRGKSGDIYNIGGGKELSNFELTKTILNQFSYSENKIEYVKDRQGHDFRYSVDYSKIQNELGYNPEIDFETGIKETIKWYEFNEDWWLPLVND